MYRLFATLTVLISPCGCAVDPVGTSAFAANGAAASLPKAPLVSETPITAVDIGGYDQVNCQNFRRPGSRILTSKRCYTVDRSIPEWAIQQQMDQEKSEQLEEIGRLQMWREEAELERQRRTLYGREAFP